MLAVILASVLVVPVGLSYLVEGLRSPPAVPTRLSWAPEIPIRYVKVDDINLRYVKVGQGPPLVLLHTLRTQLDMFQKVIPELSRHFEVYALDYPGHGFSDIPNVEYKAELFVNSVAGFLEEMNIDNATVMGESIGGTIALALAARHNPRVRRVIAVNPYDYDQGRGLRRSSGIANVLFGLNDVPLVGSTFTRFRQYPVFRKVMEGGVARTDSLPPELLREMYEVGNRPHHYQSFMSLVSHWAEWEQVRREYANIETPVLLIYGEHDWSRRDEREANHRIIPGSKIKTVIDAGHFLSLDAPEPLIQ
ncbi:MAG: alpha/beta hydrolase, partial [candidate division NC10 bacterium]|nr:alpha/beta hydrolase [candidate division NC10 bacterium]